MIWFILIPALLTGCLLWSVRRYVCFRRKDCCGKGCGCLFPMNKN
jgi:hypothetical protein